MLFDEAPTYLCATLPREFGSVVKNQLTSILIAPIRWYQRSISPGLPQRCRYSPTCSQYALQSLEVHGAFKGTLLSAWRLLRCNPWSKGGVDRVPVKGAWPSRPLDHDALMALYRDEDRAPNT